VLRLVDHRAFAAIHNARFRRFRLNFFERLVEIAKRRQGRFLPDDLATLGGGGAIYDTVIVFHPIVQHMFGNRSDRYFTPFLDQGFDPTGNGAEVVPFPFNVGIGCGAKPGQVDYRWRREFAKRVLRRNLAWHHDRRSAVDHKGYSGRVRFRTLDPSPSCSGWVVRGHPYAVVAPKIRRTNGRGGSSPSVGITVSMAYGRNLNEKPPADPNSLSRPLSPVSLSILERGCGTARSKSGVDRQLR
jgi:hypothetical protein